MPIIGKVSQIWRYPVKSMFGEQTQQASIQSMGFPDDRHWALRDCASGEIVGGKKIPRIMTLRARYAADPNSLKDGQIAPVDIEFPDGQRVSSDAPEANAQLSAYLEREVTLSPRAPASEKGHYRLTARPSLAESREMLGVQPDEENPDLSHFSLKKLSMLANYVTPPGNYYDAYPLHILTTAALAEMTKEYPTLDFRVERYRPSILIETFPSLTGLVEHEWGGQKLRIGETIIHCDHPTIRCSMPGAAQPGMAADRDIPRAVAKFANRHLGAYCTPTEPGDIAVGDEVELLETKGRAFSAGVGRATRRIRKSLLDAVARYEDNQ